LIRDERCTVEFATPLSDDEDRINAYHDDEPLRYRTLDNIFGDQPVPGLAMHNFEAELHPAHEDGEPRSFTKAKGDAAWRAAMQQEMDAVERNRTWELADLPAGHRAITLKWVYKLKKDKAGVVIKHKALWWRAGSSNRRELTSTTPSRPSRGWSPFISSSRWRPKRVGVCTTWTSSPPSSMVT
jgi:hypothetical protein